MGQRTGRFPEGLNIEMITTNGHPYLDINAWLEKNEPAVFAPPPSSPADDVADGAPAPPSQAAMPVVARSSRPSGSSRSPGHAGGASSSDRARAYLLSPGFPSSVAGQDGHGTLYRAACELIDGFSLDRPTALAILTEYNEAKAIPPESASQVEHKIDSAIERHPNPSANRLNAGRNGGQDGGRNGIGNHHGADSDDDPTGLAAAFGAALDTRGHHDDRAGHPVLSPEDIATLVTRATDLAGAGKVEDLYRDQPFLRSVARLEGENPAEVEALKAILRRIDGFRERAFQNVMEAVRRAAGGNGNGDGNGDGNGNRHGGNPGGGAAGGERPEAAEYEFSDLGNGQRLVARYGDHILYVKSYGDWLIYDGKCWINDDRLQIEKFAQTVPRQVLTEIPPAGNQEVVAAFKQWSLASQSKDKLTALVHSARSMRSIEPKDFDPNPWLLNARNGTIDLRTGECREHRAKDLITKMARVSYDPGARCPRWERFIHEIMGGDADLTGYLHRAIGYSITGVIREHVFFFLYGTGRNGKSSMLNTLFHVLGDYANDIDSDMLLAQPTKPHPTGLTDLEGRRFISADETDETKRLAESMIKKVTGGTPITARRMYENNYNFWPSHHIFMAGNHKPEIRGTDPGIWTRVKLIPFTVAFDLAIRGGRKPDLDLESKLRTEAPGILNWMIQGCMEWQVHGLMEPRVVTQQVTEYREEMDTIGWYLDECCVIDLEGKVSLGSLYGNYKDWAKESNNFALSKRKFSGLLGDKGFPTIKSHSRVLKLGLRLKSETERRMAEDDEVTGRNDHVVDDDDKEVWEEWGEN